MDELLKKGSAKKWGLMLLFLPLTWGLFALNSEHTVEGRVSYFSMKNVYVSFSSTEGLAVGDTLFLRSPQELVPALLITQLSSISCVTKSLDDMELEINTLIIAYVPTQEPVSQQEVVIVDSAKVQVVTQPVSVDKEEVKSRISGRLSVKSYSNFSTTETDNNQRMRYTLSFQGEHLMQSKFSADAYINFTHKAGEWNLIQDNIFNGLKIYSLAVKYDLSTNTNVWLGRKINTHMSNMGAIDGLQAETNRGNWTLGLAAGSRPDYTDYSVNVDLLQYGAFVAHQFQNEMGQMNNSLALFEQTNAGKTDRRFAYFQHSNSLLKKVSVFSSCELDLYQLKDSVASNVLSLTGLYFSVRYKPFKQLSLFSSYDARKNVIYYETYKNLADAILENETRQGYRFQVLWHPLTKLTVSTNAGYRYRKGDFSSSKNATMYVMYSNVPWLNVNATVNATYLSTSYLEGMQYGVSFSRDLFDGKMYSSLDYRIIDYKYASTLDGIFQNIADLSVSWRLPYRLQLSVDYEFTLESSDVFNRVFLGLSKRF